MDFWQALEGRNSVRAFDQQRDISPETITRLLEAAIRAPSAGNCQPWHFCVVRNGALKLALAQAALDQWFISEAPVVVVVCTDAARSVQRYGDRGKKLYCLQDTAAAIENLLLAAVASGLGACWVGAFDEQAASTALSLPGRLRPVAIVPLGYSAEPPSYPSQRLPLGSVVSRFD